MSARYHGDWDPRRNVCSCPRNFEVDPCVWRGRALDSAGLLRADQPWAGRFQRVAPNLAATAHITRCTRAGWYPLPAGSGSAAPVGQTVGHAVTWVSNGSHSAEFTTVIETLFATSGNTTQEVRLRMMASEGGARVHATLRLYHLR